MSEMTHFGEHADWLDASAFMPTNAHIEPEQAQRASPFPAGQVRGAIAGQLP